MKRATVAEYERMIADGTLTKRDRVELIEGRVVEKITRGSEHRTTTWRTWEAITHILPPGWHAGKEDAIGIPNRIGEPEPEPDVSMVRGTMDDYGHRNPKAEDIVLVVKVSCSSLPENRKLAATYTGAGILCDGVVNMANRTLEVYHNHVRGIYDENNIYTNADTMPLILDGQSHGPIAVSHLLPAV